MRLALLLFLLSASASAVDEKDLGPPALRMRLEKFASACSSKWSGDYGKQMRPLAREVSRQLKIKLGRFYDAFITQSRPDVWNGSGWLAEKMWENFLTELPEGARCETLTLAYGNAVYRLSTVEPSEEILEPEDSFLKTERLPASFELDQKRAAWELRFFMKGGLKSARIQPLDLVPSPCRDLLREAKARYDFIFHAPYGRKPLGIGLGKCGGPLSAHYKDAPRKILAEKTAFQPRK